MNEISNEKKFDIPTTSGKTKVCNYSDNDNVETQPPHPQQERMTEISTRVFSSNFCENQNSNFVKDKNLKFNDDNFPRLPSLSSTKKLNVSIETREGKPTIPLINTRTSIEINELLSNDQHGEEIEIKNNNKYNASQNVVINTIDYVQQTGPIRFKELSTKLFSVEKTEVDECKIADYFDKNSANPIDIGRKHMRKRINHFIMLCKIIQDKILLLKDSEFMYVTTNHYKAEARYVHKKYTDKKRVIVLITTVHMLGY